MSAKKASNNARKTFFNTKKETANTVSNENLQSTIGKNRSFAMAEAHKRLRTNVLFSFADDKKCRVIGVTSAMAHEGKTTTSINLAYDMKQAGKRVLLIDADMRLSRISKILDVNRAPGLSNILVGSISGENIIGVSTLHDNLLVITCGDPPPNPTELLSSKRMGSLIDTLKKEFEYIIIDLPPISEVADALIVSKLTDGMIIVTRQDYADRKLLDDTINQLKLNKATIIGFVMTCAQNSGRKYYKKYKGYYHKKYGYHYGYGYAQGSYAEDVENNVNGTDNVMNE